MFDFDNNNFNDLYNNAKDKEDSYYKNYDNYYNLFNAYFFANLTKSRK